MKTRKTGPSLDGSGKGGEGEHKNAKRVDSGKSEQGGEGTEKGSEGSRSLSIGEMEPEEYEGAVGVLGEGAKSHLKEDEGLRVEDYEQKLRQLGVAPNMANLLDKLRAEGTLTYPLLLTFMSCVPKGAQEQVFHVTKYYVVNSSEYKEELVEGASYSGRRNRPEGWGDRFENRGDRYEGQGDRFESRGGRFESRGDRFESPSKRFETRGDRFQGRGNRSDKRNERWETYNDGYGYNSDRDAGSVVANARAVSLVHLETEGVEEDDSGEIVSDLREEGERHSELPEHLREMFEGSADGLEEEQKLVFKRLLMRFAHVFAKDDFDLGNFTAVQHFIDTADAKPIKQKMRRTPVHFVGEEKKHLENMLKAGVIKASVSERAAPPVLVRKKDGTVRWCVDYRLLNKVT
ncbi:transposon Ty3-I Gag-Pol polyprotein [Elysia marginata]|uniref:Transposon Ty3-I Gag-Pol polyprotein n=1 Tax=Elysia marginata TaxID=1093978 RepID=A0AAV4JFT6_9GAST|nr:transposon Ty3-I Gag-Pol polyprotein [Elysia marginata]